MPSPGALGSEKVALESVLSLEILVSPSTPPPTRPTGTGRGYLHAVLMSCEAKRLQ